MDKIGQQLKAYRLGNGLDPEEVAFMLDIPMATYNAIENDQQQISLKQLLKLCQYYTIKPDVFLKPGDTAVQSKTEPAIRVKQSVKEDQPHTEEPEDESLASFHFRHNNNKRTVTAPQAINILKKSGITVDEKQATEILDFMYLLADMAIDQTERELAWEQKLQQYPKGFAITGKSFTCGICGQKPDDKQQWYDQFGLKCRACQQAVDQGIVPGEITGNDTLYYSDRDLDQLFNLQRKVLTAWIKKGLLKPRVITKADSKNKHYRIFLQSDHENFLPPLQMMRFDGGLKWFEQVDPFEYLKGYGIMAYMKYKDEPNDPQLP